MDRDLTLTGASAHFSNASTAATSETDTMHSDSNENNSLIDTNWREMDAGSALLAMEEAGVFTDTRIVGESQFGPLNFINTVNSGSGTLKQAILVRFSFYCSSGYGYGHSEITQADHYHGGDYLDEVAALISLILGIRAQSGPVTRRFDSSTDPLGTPIMTEYKPVPVLPPLHEPPRIPRLLEAADLGDLAPIAELPRLMPEAVNVVIKVARMYQQALWLADAQPAMSWLLFVSAVEAAADYWWRASPQTGRSQSLPSELIKILEEHLCDDSIKKPLSDYMAKYTGATKKFVRFILKFLPNPPSMRPHDNLQVNFSKKQLQRDLRIIYDFRSRALHGGIAFPAPMCMAPNPAYLSERPLGLGLSTHGATWWYDDTPMPMLLHVFEHIIRGAILKWIASLSDFQAAKP